MKISYYNLENDDYNKKYGSWKKKKLLTITFNHILEMIQLEHSDRGILLWINTPKTVRVFGWWKEDENKKFYQSWSNDNCMCG